MFSSPQRPDMNALGLTCSFMEPQKSSSSRETKKALPPRKTKFVTASRHPTSRQTWRLFSRRPYSFSPHIPLEQDPLSPRSSFELPANGWDSICTFSFRIPIFLSQEIQPVKSTELSVNHNWSGDSGGNMKARTTCIDRVQGMGANVYTQSTKPAHSL